PKTLIVNESQYQRLALTLLAGLANPRVKTVVMFHQLAYLRRTNRLHRRLTHWADQKLVRFADVSISAGLYLTEELRALCAPELHEKIRTVLTTSQSVPEYSETKERFLAIFVGSVVPAKGVLELIEAVSQLPTPLRTQLHVKIAGSTSDTPYHKTCVRRLRAHGLHGTIEFLGLISPQEVAALATRASLFLFPSHAEGMAMSLLEAMSAGCVPIVFNNTAMPYLVKNERSGFVVADRDIFAFAQAIESCYALDEQSVLEMRRHARSTVQPFIREWQQVAEEFLTALDDG
ncbi:MAG: glycosyltransferase family 4 protein, partial [Myxococcota bacterium]